MLKKLLAISAAAIAAAAAPLAVGARAAYAQTDDGEEQKFYSYSRTYYGMFNTDAAMELYITDVSDELNERARQLDSDVRELLTALQNSFDAGTETSYIYAFNAADAGATVEIDEYCYNVLTIAMDMYRETEGYYNPGVYYSVDLYGFSSRAEGVSMPYDRQDDQTQLPEQKYVDAFCELASSFADLQLYAEDGRYYAVKPQKTVKVEGDDNVYSLRLDLGGIGKGYAADLVDDLIDAAGFEYSYFNFGASTMAINKSVAEDGLWELGFRNPRGPVGDYYITWFDADTAVSTSGDSENYYIIDGTRYCHIINPQTGAPIQTGVITASCTGDTAARDDARTTAICAMGLERALEYINSDAVKGAGIKVSLLYENSIGWKTLYTNMEEGAYTANVTNELPSWVFVVICAAFVVIVIAGWAIYKRVKAKRENSSSPANKADGDQPPAEQQ